MLFFVKYALITFRSSNQYTISIDILSIRSSIRIISIGISKQSKHKYQEAKGKRESLSVSKSMHCAVMRILHRAIPGVIRDIGL